MTTEARDALARLTDYAKHKRECPVYWSGTCGCGLDAILAALDGWTLVPVGSRRPLHHEFCPTCTCDAAALGDES